MADGADDEIWVDLTRTRAFRIPKDASLPEGDLLLRTPLGARRRVDPVVAAVYELTGEEATAFTRAQLAAAAAKAKDAWSTLVQAARERDGSVPENPEPDSDTGKRFKDFLDHPEEIETELKSALQELGDAVKGIKMGPAVAPDAPPAEQFEQLGAEVKRVLAQPEAEQAVRGIANAFSALADALAKARAEATEKGTKG